MSCEYFWHIVFCHRYIVTYLYTYLPIFESWSCTFQKVFFFNVESFPLFHKNMRVDNDPLIGTIQINGRLICKYSILSAVPWVWNNDRCISRDSNYDMQHVKTEEHMDRLKTLQQYKHWMYSKSFAKQRAQSSAEIKIFTQPLLTQAPLCLGKGLTFLQENKLLSSCKN